MSKESTLILIAALIALIGITAIIAGYLWIRKTYAGLNDLLEKAIKDDLDENTFDETCMSALEIKLANFLSSSKVSARNVVKEKNKIKTLISDISHQTKTPVANLLLYTELLKEQDLTEEASEYVGAIYSQTEKLKFLIDSLVKLSRLENGILTLNPETKDISEVLNKLLSDHSPKAEKKGISLSVRESEDGLLALFDPKWTEEAMGNIIDNAIKYTDCGMVEVVAESTEMFLRVDIRDTGRGISEEEIPRIFSRFYRSREVSAEQGVGIGLYLAREIISAEGGYIRVNSEKGKGSTFSVFLPK